MPNNPSLSGKEIETRLTSAIEHVLCGLQKAYDTAKKEGIADRDEILLLETLVKAKNLEGELQKMFGVRKNPRVHIASITL